ncbi:MAG TPA: hypothetical protein VMT58_03550 [Candidatus Binataceae bacterium]|nr:hypothetical protein [Candidatus Binataceae bacterium]
MNLRHAAALAFLGWYLMIPRMYDLNSNPHVQPNDPVSHWGKIRDFHCEHNCETVYKTKEACEHAAAFQHLQGRKMHDPQFRKLWKKSRNLEALITSTRWH